ncbi:MAG: hypothetical protein AABY32_02435 [Nanoarchaeota archaeon]
MPDNEIDEEITPIEGEDVSFLISIQSDSLYKEKIQTNHRENSLKEKLNAMYKKSNETIKQAQKEDDEFVNKRNKQKQKIMNDLLSEFRMEQDKEIERRKRMKAEGTIFESLEI